MMSTSKKSAGRRLDEVVGEFLEAPEARAAYVEAVLADGDVATLRAALRDVARAQGMADVARRAGVGEKSLFRALGDAGNPRLDTLYKVLAATGMRLHVSAA
jgi:probable addiction module antidote protein